MRNLGPMNNRELSLEALRRTRESMDSLSPELQQIARRAQRGGIVAYQKARVAWDQSQATKVLVEQATANAVGFASNKDLATLAAASHEPEELHRIMKVLLRRLGDEAKDARNWRKVLRALQVAYHLLTHGSDAAVDAISERVITFIRLEDGFAGAQNPLGDRDAIQGAKLVRAKAKATLQLLRDPASLAQKRAEAQKSAGKYVGIGSSDEYFGSPSASPAVVVSTAGRAPMKPFSVANNAAIDVPFEPIATPFHRAATKRLPPPPPPMYSVTHRAAPTASPFDLLSSTPAPATTWQEFVSGPAPPPPPASAIPTGLPPTSDPFEGLLLELDHHHAVGHGMFVDNARAAALASTPMLPDVATAWSPPSQKTSLLDL
jgi:ENTH domain